MAQKSATWLSNIKWSINLRPQNTWPITGNTTLLTSVHVQKQVLQARGFAHKRKYKDYVYGKCYYRSTWKNKEQRLRTKDKAENGMMYQDKYNCICQNTKIHYVKPTAQLLLKVDFQKVDQHAGLRNLLFPANNIGIT